MAISASRRAAPGSRSPARDVHDAITAVMRWASRGDVRRELMGPAGRDLTPTDTWLLALIDEQGPLRGSELAARQGVDKSTMTPQVRRLESRGLVSRRVDDADRRAALLALTPKGALVRRRTKEAGTAVIERVLSTWPDADQDALAELLTRFVNQLDERRSAS